MKVFGFYGTSVRVNYAIRVDKLFLQNVAFLIHHPESCILNDLSGNIRKYCIFGRRPIRNDHGAIYQAATVIATSEIHNVSFYQIADFYAEIFLTI